MLFCSLKEGLVTPKIRMLCSVIINSVFLLTFYVFGFSEYPALTSGNVVRFIICAVCMQQLIQFVCGTYAAADSVCVRYVCSS